MLQAVVRDCTRLRSLLDFERHNCLNPEKTMIALPPSTKDESPFVTRTHADLLSDVRLWFGTGLCHLLVQVAQHACSCSVIQF